MGRYLKEEWIIARQAVSGYYVHEVVITTAGQLPSPHNGNFDALNAWMEAHVADGWRWYWTVSDENRHTHDALLIAFESRSEALLFKLTWGGS